MSDIYTATTTLRNLARKYKGNMVCYSTMYSEAADLVEAQRDLLAEAVGLLRRVDTDVDFSGDDPEATTLNDVYAFLAKVEVYK